MEDTCFKDCHLWKKFGEKCPNRVVGYWLDDHAKQEKRVIDCAPKRILEELKVIHNLLIGLQRTSNQERNASNALVGVMTELVKKAQEGRVMINGFDPQEAALPAPKS